MILSRKRERSKASSRRRLALAVLLWTVQALPTFAQSTATNVPPTAEAPTTGAEDAIRLGRLITQLVLERVPHSYLDDDAWGQTRRIWDGVGLRRDGLRVETYRRWRTVNHGTWHRASIRLVDPESTFRSEVADVQPRPDGRTGFTLVFGTPLAIEARQAHWINGVQMYSINIEATAEVVLRLECDLGLQADYGMLPPDLVLDPAVRAAKLELVQFRIHRVSKLGGEFAQQATRLVREPLERQLVEHQERIVEKCNEAIARHRDQWRISLSSALQSRWRQFVADALRPIDRWPTESTMNEDR